MWLIAGDMSRLDALVRMKLSKLLDPIRPGSDWRELAGRLKLGYILHALELQKSSTKALLDNYEVCRMKSPVIFFQLISIIFFITKCVT